MKSVEYSPAKIFSQVITANSEEFGEIQESGELEKLAEIVFAGLVGSRAAITREEVVTFAVSTEYFDTAYAEDIFNTIVKRQEASVAQFTEVFQKLIETVITLREREVEEKMRHSS